MNKGIIIFIEGYTEKELYDSFMKELHSMCTNKRFKIDKLIVRNLKGIGNYKNRAVRVFVKDILPKNQDTEFKIFLCYDTDVFDFSKTPPVDWKEVEKSLKEFGAKRVFHVKARYSIEDWILEDIEGLCKYLKVPKPSHLKGNKGLLKIQHIFKKAHRIYVKGTQVKGLVDSLDIKRIMCSGCKQLMPLCKEIGVNCNKIK